LETSCHDRGNRWRAFRRSNSFAKQKARDTAITGNCREFFRRDERARRKSIYRPSRKLSGDKPGAYKLVDDKPTNPIINLFRLKIWLVARILRYPAKDHPL
jgi:hypothetical protein